MRLIKENDSYGHVYYVLIDAILLDGGMNADGTRRYNWCDFAGERHQDRFGNPDHLIELDLSDEEEIANALKEEGFNVKPYVPKNSEDPQAKPVVHLQVKLPYRDGQEWLAPKIRTCVNGVMNDISKETIGTLSSQYIENANLTLRRHEWSYLGNTGITAQLVDGEFYIRGSKQFRPSYMVEAEQQDPNDDLPF